MSTSKLTYRQENFIREFQIDLNPVAAAKRAGYSEGSAAVAQAYLMSIPKVREEIDRAKSRAARRVELEVTDILLGLLEEAQGRGEDTSSTARIAAWKLLGQHIGLFSAKVEVTGKDGGSLQVEHSVSASQVFRSKLDALAERNPQ